MEAVGSSDGRSYTTVPRTMGPEMCCLEAAVDPSPQRFGEFIVPDRVDRNGRAIYYRVVKAGSDVYPISGVREGDYVFVDALARFSDTYPISFINCRNVLFITDRGGTSMRARRGRVLARIHEPSSENGPDGFVRLMSIDPWAEVVSIGDGCGDRGYRVGDRLSVTSSADMYVIGGVKYFDFDWRAPVFRFEGKGSRDGD